MMLMMENSKDCDVLSIISNVSKASTDTSARLVEMSSYIKCRDISLELNSACDVILFMHSGIEILEDQILKKKMELCLKIVKNESPGLCWLGVVSCGSWKGNVNDNKDICGCDGYCKAIVSRWDLVEMLGQLTCRLGGARRLIVR